MSGVGFLLIALALSIIGSLFVWWRSRNPERWDSGIDDFAKKMDALDTGRRGRKKPDRPSGSD